MLMNAPALVRSFDHLCGGFAKRAYRRLVRASNADPGPDPLGDIARRLPAERVDTIFDVGANVGQSSREFISAFPNATIYSFEPSPETFAKLLEGIPTCERFLPHNMGLSSRQAMLRFDTRRQNDMHRIGPNQEDETLPLVEVTTLSAFCKSSNVGKIDYLKIDTEGHDLEVLRGAQDMLAAGAIALAQAECSVNRDNKYHVPFSELHSYMENLNYRLFGIYEQTHEWTKGKPILRRVNVVYASQQVVERNRMR
jgi:FkbM family methyltransferase